MKNPVYTRFSKTAMWLDILFVMPLKCWQILDREPATADYFELVLYLYLLVANYICGYRLYSPPAWSRFLVRQKWIDEWRYLSETHPDETRDNHRKLHVVVAGTIVMTVLLLATVHGKL